MKKVKRIIRRWGTAVLAILTFFALSAAAYYFFKAFTSPPFNAFQSDSYITELMAAFLGAVITMILTFFLLKSQSSLEEHRENRKQFFDAKLKLYMDFFERLSEMFEDCEISAEEIGELKKWALKLSLVSKTETSGTIVRFIRQHIEFREARFADLDGEGRKRFAAFARAHYDCPADQAHCEKLFVDFSELLAEIKKDLETDLSADEKDFLKATRLIESMYRK
jgi:hypothetical protein